MHGALLTVEVAVEWGLAIYQDTAANALLPPARRRVRRTELMVLELDASDADRGGAAPAEEVLLGGPLR
eukprot:8036800-Lingulodinium_polyedra.AAC.1